jgi:hypothetical protein
MDPTATLEAMIDHMDAEEFDEARECARDLIHWLAGHGFPPIGCNERETRELCQQIIRNPAAVTAESLCIGE